DPIRTTLGKNMRAGHVVGAIAVDGDHSAGGLAVTPVNGGLETASGNTLIRIGKDCNDAVEGLPRGGHDVDAADCQVIGGGNHGRAIGGRAVPRGVRDLNGDDV